MNNILDEIKNLKIVPENYKSATVCDISEISDSTIKLNLPYVSEDDLKDYIENNPVELFGLAKHGLAYFTADILKKNGKEIILNIPVSVKEIQRRKYSRVPFDGVLFVKEAQNAKIQPDDISAGGLKFTSDTPFMVGSEYNIKIELVNNLVVDCTMQPIRVEETEDDEKLPYSISAKYKKIRSIDRIALMQYSLRLISESENKS